MRKIILLLFVTAALYLTLGSCGGSSSKGEGDTSSPNDTTTVSAEAEIVAKVEAYVKVPLSADISHLTQKEREMLKIFYQLAPIMNELFWQQAYGDEKKCMESMPSEPYRQFAAINYGPWERLNGNTPFVPGVGPKPLGANFYPPNMTREEFAALQDPEKESMYTILRWNDQGQLVVIPYAIAYGKQINEAANLLEKAATYAEDPAFKKYLELRADALRTDEYQASDFAWLDVKNNTLDLVVGPIENYEDKLFGIKTAYEAFILLKDLEWTKRLERYMTLLPELQKSLPVPPEYKKENPGSNSDLGVYDALYYAGDCNAGSKTIAINLPNDPEVQLKKGSRRLQLKNAMQYKFDLIVKPISEILIDPSQQEHIKFDAFFENTMFHEVAHGLGIKRTIDGKRTAHEALLDTYSAIEEGKADILGIFMIEQLIKMGELKDHDIMDNYVTFMAGIFRSVRFGAASAHGKANMVRFHYFQDMGAFVHDPSTGYYKIDKAKMTAAVESLARDILILQGDGNYEGAKKMLETQGIIDPALQADLDRINKANIPIDLRYEQGPELIGLK